MPVISMNMAVPMGNQRESQIYFLSNPQIHNVTPPPIQRKYFIFKLIQLILCFASLLVLFCGTQAIRSTTVQDMLICTTLGALLVYPLFFIIFHFTINQKSSFLIAANFLATATLLIISICNFSTWMNSEIVLEKLQNEHPDKKYLMKKNFAAINLSSFILTFLNSVIYLGETIIIYLEIKGYI